MKFFKAFVFIVVGIAGLIAAISLVSATAGWFLVNLLFKKWVTAIIMGLLWFIETYVMCWFIGGYHGE